ncbi:MAG: O-antigen ligase family protein [Paludibacteraceae bacterium]
MNRYQNILGYINYYLFFLALIGLTLPPRIGSTLGMLWLVSYLLEGRWLQRKNLRIGKHLIPFVLLLVYALWFAISISWADDVNEAKNAANQYFVFPFLFLVALFGVNPLYRDKRYLITFLKACVIIVPTYYFAVYCAQNGNYFLYGPSGHMPDFHLVLDKSYSSHIKHRLFFCMVLTLGLVSIPTIYRQQAPLYQQKQALSWRVTCPRWAQICLLAMASIIICLGIYYTGSRASIFTGLLLLTTALLIRFVDKRHWWRGILIIAALIIAVFCTIKYHPRMQLADEDPRVSIYNSALGHINEVPFFGLGAGQQHQFIIDKYVEDGYTIGAQKGFDTHNQYLATYIELGPLAVLLLLAVFISLPLVFHGNARRLSLMLSLLYLSNMLTDNVLERFDPLTTLLIFMTLILACEQYPDSELPSPSLQADS